MLRFLAIFFACMLFFGAQGGEAEDAAPFSARGDSNYPPYEFTDADGKPSGFNVEILKAAAEETGMDLNISLGPWNQVRAELENRKIDIITGMYFSEERDARVDFSVAHTMVSHAVFVREENTGTDPLSDLAGMALIVQHGDIMHYYASEKQLGSSIHPVETPQEAMFLLASGIHDCALLPLRQGLYLIEKQGLENIIALEPPIMQSKYCFAVQNGEAALLNRLNEGLFALKSKGRYRQIHDRWFGIYEEKNPWQTLKYWAAALAAAL
ncbi:MAG: transporter substrate-binding domain-containing protein, partial [Desulfosalsimonas sp.]